MAVGSFHWPGVSPIKGVRLASGEAGIKYANRKDVALIEIAKGASVSAVFTKNAFAAEPIKICQQHLATTTPRYLLINSGNANACTGVAGFNAALSSCKKVAELAGVMVEEVLPFSTGVIGEVLPSKLLVKVLPEVYDALEDDSWKDAAQAMMTTDTRPKGLSCRVDLDGNHINISGIAKGSGMIKPNMGTMLAYIATDAAIAKPVLDEMIRRAAKQSFNRITIDGDTSTNDAMVVIATGGSNAVKVESMDSADGKKIAKALCELSQQLAVEMVRDAEGATKCVTVEVEGGGSEQECLDVAYAICHSPLVKTAVFASDANWGRIVAAIGYAGLAELDISKIRVWLDDVLIVDRGERADSYSENDGAAVFIKEEFCIKVQLGRGDYRDTLWTSDLSHDYIKINADYRS